jgi:hypothetical protein
MRFEYKGWRSSGHQFFASRRRSGPVSKNPWSSHASTGLSHSVRGAAPIKTPPKGSGDQVIGASLESIERQAAKLDRVCNAILTSSTTKMPYWSRRIHIASARCLKRSTEKCWLLLRAMWSH